MKTSDEGPSQLPGVAPVANVAGHSVQEEVALGQVGAGRERERQLTNVYHR